MTPQESYERECEVLDRQLELGQITKAEHLRLTREPRYALREELWEDHANDEGLYRD